MQELRRSHFGWKSKALRRIACRLHGYSERAERIESARRRSAPRSASRGRLAAGHVAQVRGQASSDRASVIREVKQLAGEFPHDTIWRSASVTYVPVTIVANRALEPKRVRGSVQVSELPALGGVSLLIATRSGTDLHGALVLHSSEVCHSARFSPRRPELSLALHASTPSSKKRRFATIRSSCADASTA